MPVTQAQVMSALQNVMDPEINFSLVDLGLVYGVDIAPLPTGKFKVTARVTLTTPSCPYGPALLDKAQSEIMRLSEVEEAAVELVWVPPWDPRTMASDEAKMQMGFFDLEETPNETMDEKSS